MRLLLVSLMSALALVLCSSCASPEPFGQVKSFSGNWQGTGILLAYKLSTRDSETRKQGCKLVLGREGSADESSITLRPEQSSVLFRGEAGKYVWKKLSCPHFVNWDLGSMGGDSFTVAQGKINYLGQIAFVFSRDNSDMHVKKMGSDAALKSLIQAIAGWPDSWAQSLEDPYTGKPIPPAVLRNKNTNHMEIRVRRVLGQGETPVSTSSLEASLRTCDLEEQERFPYRIGSLEMTASYQSGVLKSLKTDGENAFSDGFLQCLSDSFHSFSPDEKAHLSVTVSL